MIVVTTPNGNVGSEVVRLLATHVPPLPFRVAAHQPEKIRQRYGPDIPCVRFDFGDPATWSPALEGISILFLVCPQPDPRTIQAHILPFIDAAIEAGCQHIIYQSVPGADQAKIIPHARIERHLEATGVSYTILRPAYFMQNFTREAPTHGVDIATRHEIFIPAGKGRLSLIDARDVACAVIKICEDPVAHRNRAYKLTGSEALDLYDVARTFSQVLGEPVRYTHPSLPRFWFRLRQRHVPWSLLLVMSVEYTLTRLGRSGSTSDTLTTLLGRPPTTLAQFIEDHRQRWIARAHV